MQAIRLAISLLTVYAALVAFFAIRWTIRWWRTLLSHEDDVTDLKL
jgi:hypothetical protein